MNKITKRLEFVLNDINCASCVNKISKGLLKKTGKDDFGIDLVEKTLWIRTSLSAKEVISIINKIGYKAILKTKEKSEEEKKLESDKSIKLLFLKGILAGVFGIVLFITDSFNILPNITTNARYIQLILGIITLLVMLYSGFSIYKKAWQALIHKQLIMDSLVALSTSIAWVYSMFVALFPFAIPVLARHVYFEATIPFICFYKWLYRYDYTSFVKRDKS